MSANPPASPLVRFALKAFAIVVVLILLRFVVLGTPFDEQDLLGMTPAEVRARYGEPRQIRDYDPNDDEVAWLYTHGFIGTASLVEFKNGRVVSVRVSYGR